MEYRYSLEQGSRKFRCPECGQNTFVRYKDKTTGEYLSFQFGRCDREIKCGYFKYPKQESRRISSYQIIQSNNFQVVDQYQNSPEINKDHSEIPSKIFKQSRSDYSKNNFIIWLKSIYNINEIEKAISNYHIGTSSYWPGSTIFWQIDQAGKIRAGKIMLFDALSGHRKKKPYKHITWVHRVYKMKDFALKQCFFGEHLLNKYPEYPIGIVEAEKTSIIANIHFPQVIWLGTGNLNGLSLDRCKVLKGRKVILFPDLDGYQKWTLKAAQISVRLKSQIIVSDALRKYANADKLEEGADVADFLIQVGRSGILVQKRRPSSNIV